MKISVVTISFNQAEFLERTIRSVLSQRDANFEYIVVDPGSTDGSRQIIEKYKDQITKMVFKSDKGAADGLNNGFSEATGDVYYYLNADDVVKEGAFAEALAYFRDNPEIDVLCGHGWAIDSHDKILRRVWSYDYQKGPVAYGASIQIQPSTFIKAVEFKKVNGFNVDNRTNWDGELLLDLFLNGAKFKIANRYWSYYRLHTTSITNSGVLHEKMAKWDDRRFRALMSRPPAASDAWRKRFWLFIRYLSHPVSVAERIFKGPVYRRGA